MTTTTDADIPQVRFWAVPDLTGLDFDPLLAKLLHEDPVTRVRLPHGEGYAWLVTRYEDVKFVSVDPRFSRQAVWGRSITRVAPTSSPWRAPSASPTRRTAPGCAASSPAPSAPAPCAPCATTPRTSWTGSWTGSRSTALPST
ncbi:hypothetical protein [Streptomyces sp. NPDC058664]|uniref:hypothetical protein n=1 Tax=unclassified Streptomyces TaxID=2593676 RepID=UPI003652C7E7